MSRLTTVEKTVAACRAVLKAAETTLVTAGLSIPERSYVSIQGGDWITGDCENCCEQLIVAPMMLVQRWNNPITSIGTGDASAASIARLVDFHVIHSTAVNIHVAGSRLVPGEVDGPWQGQEGTHWHESVMIATARWAFATTLAGDVSRELCAAGIPCTQSYVTLIEPILEGGCGGSKVTVQVQM